MAMGGGGDRGSINSDINVTPMADVMLVMLIIFMVVTPMLSKGFDVDKVKTVNAIDMPAADRDDAIIVAVTRDGKYYLGSDKVTVDDLAVKIGEKVKDRADKTVFVKGDSRAKYGDVKDVVDNIRGYGVDKIGLLTERIDDQVRK
jgi:biopolymer transport protein ExbD/biopolymer transport protein TolR